MCFFEGNLLLPARRVVSHCNQEAALTVDFPFHNANIYWHLLASLGLCD